MIDKRDWYNSVGGYSSANKLQSKFMEEQVNVWFAEECKVLNASKLWIVTALRSV